MDLGKVSRIRANAVRLWQQMLRSQLARGTAWMSYANGLGLVFQGVYFIALARGLGPHGLGTFAAALAIVSIASSFGGWGGGNLLVRATVHDRASYREALGMSLSVIAVSGTAFVCVALGASLYFSTSAVAACVLPLAVSEVVLAPLAELAGQCFQAHDRLKVTANIAIGQSVLRLLAIFLFLALGVERTATTWSIWYAAVSGLWAAASLGALFWALGLPIFDSPLRRFRFKEGFFFALGSASKSVYSDIDKTMLAIMRGSAIAGFYTAAYRVVAFAYAPIQAYVFSSNTRFFRDGVHGPQRLWQLARRALPALWGYAIITAVGMWVLAPLLTVLLGARYAPSVEALRWLAIMPLIMATHYFLGDALMAVGRQGIRSTVQVVAAGINIGLNLWLIPSYGYRGAAVASIVAETLLSFALALLLWRLAAGQRRQRQPGDGILVEVPRATKV